MSVSAWVYASVCAEAKGEIRSQHTQSCSLSCSESQSFISLLYTLKNSSRHRDSHTRPSRIQAQYLTSTGRKKDQTQKKTWKFICLFFYCFFLSSELGHKVLFLFTAQVDTDFPQTLGSNKAKRNFFLFFHLLLDLWTWTG